MSDKQRHRHQHAPHGVVPNWVLVAVGAGAVLLAQLARSLA